MRCLACNNLVNMYIDDQFCPECYVSYLENLNDIMPKDKDQDEKN